MDDSPHSLVVICQPSGGAQRNIASDGMPTFGGSSIPDDLHFRMGGGIREPLNVVTTIVTSVLGRRGSFSAGDRVMDARQHSHYHEMGSTSTKEV